MLYKIINSDSLRLKRTILIYLLIFSYLITFSGCSSTETLYSSPDTFNPALKGEITKLILRNGSKINCIDKNLRIEKTSSSEGFIIISSIEIVDTIKEGSDRYSYKTALKEQKISLADTAKIQYEGSEDDPVNSIVVIGLIVGLVVLVGVIIGTSHTVKKITE